MRSREREGGGAYTIGWEATVCLHTQVPRCGRTRVRRSGCTGQGQCLQHSKGSAWRPMDGLGATWFDAAVGVGGNTVSARAVPVEGALESRGVGGRTRAVPAAFTGQCVAADGWVCTGSDVAEAAGACHTPDPDPPSAPHTTICSVAALARKRCRTYLGREYSASREVVGSPWRPMEGTTAITGTSIGMPHMAEYTCCSSVAIERPNESTFTLHSVHVPYG